MSAVFKGNYLFYFKSIFASYGKLFSAVLWQGPVNFAGAPPVPFPSIAAFGLLIIITMVPNSPAISATGSCQSIKTMVAVNHNKVERLIKESGPKVCAYYLALSYSENSSQYAQDRARYWVNYAYQFADRRGHPRLTADILALRIYLESSKGTLDNDLTLLKFLDEPRFKILLEKKYRQIIPTIRKYLFQPLSSSCPISGEEAFVFRYKPKLRKNLTDACSYALSIKHVRKIEFTDLSVVEAKLEELKKFQILVNTLLDEIRRSSAEDNSLIQSKDSAERELKKTAAFLKGWREYFFVIKEVENAQTALEEMQGLMRAIKISKSLLGGRDPRRAQAQYNKNRFLKSVLIGIERMPASVPSMETITEWLKADEIDDFGKLKKTLAALKDYHICLKSPNRIQNNDPCVKFVLHMNPQGELSDQRFFRGFEKLKEKVGAKVLERVELTLNLRPLSNTASRLLAEQYSKWTKQILSPLELANLKNCIDGDAKHCLSTKATRTIIEKPPSKEMMVLKTGRGPAETTKIQKPEEITARTSAVSDLNTVFWKPMNTRETRDVTNIDLSDANIDLDDNVLTESNRRKLFDSLPSPWEITKEDAASILNNIAYLKFIGWDISELAILEAKAHMKTGSPAVARGLFMSWLQKEGLGHRHRERILKELIIAIKESGADGPLEN